MGEERRRDGTEATRAESRPVDAHGPTVLVAHPPSRDAQPDPLVGTVLGGRYRLLECIGGGGMGVVYRAEQIALRRRVAVKLLHAHVSGDPELRARFEREALAVASLAHPNVVAAIDFGVADERFYMVMEYVDGVTLRALLARTGRLAPARALHIARQIGSALQRAHGAGIVHRDLKPDNVVLVDQGNGLDEVKVIDFGVAKLAAERAEGQPITQTGAVIGTLQYMAPEQAVGGRVDHRADLFALGVITFEMLVGARPFEAADLGALVARHLSGAPPQASTTAPPGALPPAVDAVLARMMSASASARYGSGTEFVEDLEAAFAGRPTRAAAVVPSGPGGVHRAAEPTRIEQLARGSATPRARPSRAPWLLGGGLALAAASGVGYLAMREPDTAPSASAPTTEFPPHVADDRAPRVEPPAGPMQPNAPSARPSLAPTPTPTPRAPETAPTPRAAGATTNALPGALGARIAQYSARSDVARLLDAARRGYLTVALQGFEGQRARGRDVPLPAYFLGTLYVKVPSGYGPGLDRYNEALRAEPAFATDPVLVRDVVRGYARGERRAESILRGPLARTAAPELRAQAASSRDGRVRTRLSTLAAQLEAGAR